MLDLLGRYLSKTIVAIPLLFLGISLLFTRCSDDEVSNHDHVKMVENEKALTVEHNVTNPKTLYVKEDDSHEEVIVDLHQDQEVHQIQEKVVIDEAHHEKETMDSAIKQEEQEIVEKVVVIEKQVVIEDHKDELIKDHEQRVELAQIDAVQKLDKDIADFRKLQTDTRAKWNKEREEIALKTEELKKLIAEKDAISKEKAAVAALMATQKMNLEKESEVMHTALDSQQAELNEKSLKLKADKEAIEKKSLELKELAEKLDQEKTEFTKQKEAFEATKAELEQNRATFEEEKTALEPQKAELVKSKETFEAAKLELEQNIAKLEEEKTAFDSQKAEFVKLQEAFERAKAELDQNIVKFEEEKTAFSGQKSEFANLQKEFETKKIELQNFSKEIDDKKAQLLAVEEEAKGVINQKESLLEKAAKMAALAAHQAEFDKAEEIRKKQDRELEVQKFMDLKTSVTKEENKLEQFKVELEKQKVELEKAKAEFDANKVLSEKEIATKKQELNDLMKSLQIKEGELKATEQEIKKEKILNSFALTKVEFKYNSSQLVNRSKKLLDEAATTIKAHSNYKYEIQGHTDANGNEDYNLKLSTSRAESVKEYLIKQGVNPDILTAKGYGSSVPIADNSTNEGRLKNRRVVFKILK
jgi:outer membrane protein OmpA-like peptidoglycan-associated protein